MVLVLLSLRVVFKEYFDLVIHLRTNILEEETGNYGYNSKRHGGQSNVSSTLLVYHLHHSKEEYGLPDGRLVTSQKGAAGCSCNGCRQAWYLVQGGSAQR